MMLKRFFLAGFFFLAASPLWAADWSYDYSGNLQGFYGYGDLSNRFQTGRSRNHQNAKGNFSVSLSYDSVFSLNMDLMAGVNQELKDYNQGEWGEEIYAVGDTKYGRLMLGQTANIAEQLSVGAPDLGFKNRDIVNFIRNPNWQRNKEGTRFATLNAAYVNTDGVAPKISYMTPEFYNTYVGFSYVPDIYNRRGLVSREADYEHDDGYVAGLQHYREIGPVELTFSLGYALYHRDDQEFSGGLSLNYGNWTLGGAYRRTYVDGTDSPLADSRSLPAFFDGYREGYAWDVGLGYEFGPYKAALSYFASRADNQPNKDNVVMFSNTYRYNKWLEFYLIAAHVDFKGETANLEANNQGYAYVAGISLDF